MIKTPEFEAPKVFGLTTDRLPMEPGDICITQGAEVDLRYRGRSVSIRVTKVISPQTEFEGIVQAFDNHEIEHEELKYGDVVRFMYDKIGHIHKWIESDQP